MRRLFGLVFCILLASTLGLGSVAHAVEPVVCLDSVQASEMGHTSGDSDEVPADQDKAFPHHHGTCHGHQIGEAARTVAAPRLEPRAIALLTGTVEPFVSTEVETDLRPPIA